MHVLSARSLAPCNRIWAAGFELREANGAVALDRLALLAVSSAGRKACARDWRRSIEDGAQLGAQQRTLVDEVVRRAEHLRQDLQR